MAQSARLLDPARIVERGRVKRARGHRPKVGRRPKMLEVFHIQPRNQQIVSRSLASIVMLLLGAKKSK